MRLENIWGYLKHPIYKPLLHYKKIAKLLCTYGEKFANNVNPATGRIHASFYIGGTNTGRFSSSSPNLQNLPRNKDFRALFSAPPGRVLVLADYNQIELRVAALVSKDTALLEAYEQGQDLHEQIAATISKIPIDQVTKEQRQAAKAVNYGLLFGQGAAGLVRYARDKFNVDMTIQEAQVARETFFHAYPQLGRWQKAQDRLPGQQCW